MINIDEAESRLKTLVGQDLRPLAEQLGITVFHSSTGKLNKGWAGHTMLKFLGLPLDSKQEPDGGDWELKVIPLNRDRGGKLKPKETMAITMINAVNVTETEFEVSHLYNKLKSLIICGREFIDRNENNAPLISVDKLDIENSENIELLEQIKQDYNYVRYMIITHGFQSLSGKMGIMVQPRTKGPGHGSTSRAFYARTRCLKRLLKFE